MLSLGSGGSGAVSKGLEMRSLGESFRSEPAIQIHKPWPPKEAGTAQPCFDLPTTRCYVSGPRFSTAERPRASLDDEEDVWLGRSQIVKAPFSITRKFCQHFAAFYDLPSTLPLFPLYPPPSAFISGQNAPFSQLPHVQS